jgi:hypothetical protein
MDASPSPDAGALLDLISDVTAASAAVYGARDDAGHAMDTVKVVADGAGGYLGIYHTGTGHGFDVHLATSGDLVTWRHRVRLETQASQPTIAAVPGGGFLTAVEAGGHGRPAWLRLRRYPDLDRLLSGEADATFDAPHTLAPRHRLAEGTPNIYRVTPAASTVDIGFHYLRRRFPLWFGVDRQARGTLVDFRRWSTRREPDLDAAVAAQGVAGNIGGRDYFTWRGRPYSLIEGQLRPRRWETWRVFLYDWSARTAYPVPIRTAAGSVSFGNPTLTVLTAPSGRPAIVVTAYLFPAGAAPGEAGPLLYYRTLDSDWAPPRGEAPNPGHSR